MREIPPEYPVAPGKDPRVPLQIEQNPRTINYSEIDWDYIKSILRQAERGNTERWADLSRRMLGDGHLASNVETRKLAIAVAKLAIEPVDPDDEIDVRGAADAQRMIDGLPVSRIKRDAADGIFVGWACLEIKYECRGPWLWPASVEWNHPRRFRFGWDFKPYIYDDGRAAADMHKLSSEERQRCRDLNIVGMPLDPYRWIVHMPRSFPDYPQMGGVLLSAVRAWWIKSQALRCQLAGAESAGNGLTIGTNDPAADDATKRAFLENVGNLGASGAIVLSPGAKLERISPLAQGSASVWSTLIAECNSEESKAILGSTLAVEAGPTGSRAQAETQKSVTIDPRAEVDDDEIRHTLHRDLVDVFLELNRWAYGGRKPNVRTRSIWVEEDAPQVDELLVNAGVVTKNQLLASRGLPPLQDGGDEIASLPQQGGFGAFAEPPSVAAAEPAAPIEIVTGATWTDSRDGHRLKVNALDAERVYLLDLDGENPGEQFAWARATFRERCIPPAPGGASAASPLRDGSEDGGDAAGGALSSEAHGDLWALADSDRQAALTGVGHPGLLTAQAMLDGVPLFERLRSSLIDAVGKATSTATLATVLKTWSKRKAPHLTEQLRETNLHARMAGMLFVAQYEVPELFKDGPVALDSRTVPPFLALPFDEAIAAFERRRVVSPEEFAAMDEASRSEAFTATLLAHETLVQRARDLLLRTLRDGGTFDEFRTALVTDEAALGVTPSSPWYLETVYRSNVSAAYSTGRMDLLTSPAVRAVRPYLEWRTSRDDRVRDSHAEMEGMLFDASDPNVRINTPPYLGGVFQFNERCVVVARRAEDVDTSRLFVG